MAGARFVIFPRSEGWRVANVREHEVRFVDLERGEYTSPQEQATAMASTLDREGYAGGGVLLALPTDWCLSGTITMEGLPRQQRRQAMLYRFEEKLPVAAEEVVADFAVGKGRSLAVCVRLEQVAPIVQALESAGVAIQSICPSALLAVQDRTRNGKGFNLVLWECDVAEIELVAVEDGLPIIWHRISACADELRRHASYVASQSSPPLKVLTICANAATTDALNGIQGCEYIPAPSQHLEEVAALAAVRVLNGTLTPTVDLRRDGLASGEPYRRIRKPLIAAFTAGTVLLVCLIGSLLWRAERYAALATQLRQHQETVFKEAFPTAAPPPSIRSRLISEERRLRGVAGASSQLPRQVSAAQLLHDLLAGLPRDLRYRVQDVRLGPEKLFLEGEARSHADVDSIAAALQKDGSFGLDPPRTAQISDGGVTFTINGTYKPELYSAKEPR